MLLSTSEVAQQGVTPKLAWRLSSGGFSRHHSGSGRAFALERNCSNRIELMSGSLPVSSRAAAASLARHSPCPKAKVLSRGPGSQGFRYPIYPGAPHRIASVDSTLLHTPVTGRVACRAGPQTARASFLRTRLSGAGVSISTSLARRCHAAG